MDIISFLSLVIVLILAVITYQDLSYRTLDVRLGLLLFVSCCIYNFSHPFVNFMDAIFVILFIAMNMAVLFIYFSIKNKKVFNPIDTKIGLGDVVFLIAITPLFLFTQFILFFISGLLFSLLLSLAVKIITQQKKTIPLAGYLSVYLASIFIINFIFNKSFLHLGNL